MGYNQILLQFDLGAMGSGPQSYFVPAAVYSDKHMQIGSPATGQCSVLALYAGSRDSEAEECGIVRVQYQDLTGISNVPEARSGDVATQRPVLLLQHTPALGHNIPALEFCDTICCMGWAGESNVIEQASYIMHARDPEPCQNAACLRITEWEFGGDHRAEEGVQEGEGMVLEGIEIGDYTLEREWAATRYSQCSILDIQDRDMHTAGRLRSKVTRPLNRLVGTGNESGKSGRRVGAQKKDKIVFPIDF
ncbi:hypothetical protein FIBSPDRAFT_972830 [Athelia psychrophila]|uniref:Uncharacterized protein n=1 Tax=Athelia psychrophila TaxID=1759441 RepID=A0A167T3L5_9AGAM|nr:hypothetical protein FIBSPDRAFT_972830 [Fibularhizoctonia sp. CBS 109695]